MPDGSRRPARNDSIAAEEVRRGSHPSSVLARVQSITGRPRNRSSQGGVCRHQPEVPRCRGGGPHRPCRHLDRAALEDLRQAPGIEHWVGGDVERAAHRRGEGEAVGLRDVLGMNRLEPQPREIGHGRDAARADEPAGEEGPAEDPELLGRRRSLERERRPQADDS